MFLLTVSNKKITGLDLVIKTAIQAALHLPESKFSSGRWLCFSQNKCTLSVFSLYVPVNGFPSLCVSVKF